MNPDYARYKQFYEQDNFSGLLAEDQGRLWLKLQTIRRRPYLVEFCQTNQLTGDERKLDDFLSLIFSQLKDEVTLDDFIKNHYRIERKERKLIEAELVSELYKVHELNWGGLHGNRLEGTLVDRYIKRIKRFDELSEKIDSEIQESVRGYVISSWYNHWTSILIEDLFRDQPKVLPAIGKMNKVDFFLDGIPFDLKVTYFPEEYMKKLRKEHGWVSEATMMKRAAKKAHIETGTTLQNKELTIELIERLRNHPDVEARDTITRWESENAEIVKDSRANPSLLIKWLYENQGERRFDAGYRLFLILIDKKNPSESWKMKRNIDLLRSEVSSFCRIFESTDLSKYSVEFEWKGHRFSTISSALFVVQ